MKTEEQFQKRLKQLGSCSESRIWAKELTAKEAWEQCERGDWLLWWATKENVSLNLIMIAKGKVAETVMHLMNDERSKKAVQCAIDFGEGKISIDMLNKSASEAYSAAHSCSYVEDSDVAYYEADPSSVAAYAALYASQCDTNESCSQYAASYAANASYYYADLEYRFEAMKENRIMTANIVRQIIKPYFLL